MPLKLTIKVGTDEITADGDFQIDEQVVKLTEAWVKALPTADQQAAEQEAQAQIDAATGRLRASQTGLESNVADHPFPSASSFVG